MTYPYPRSFQKRGIPFDRVVSKSYWDWRTNPALMVPTLLSSSISVLTQSIFVIFGTILILDLESNGTLNQITSALNSGNTSALSTLLVSPGLLDPMVEYLGLALIVSILFSYLAGGFAYSAEFNSYIKAIGGSSIGIVGVMSTLKLKWRKMAWTSFLTDFFTFLPVGLLSLLGIASIALGGPNPASLLGLLGLIFIGLLLSALVSFLLMYSLILVAAEDLSGILALSKSYEMSKGNFGVSFTYALVRVLSLALVTVVANITSSTGVPLSSLASIAITLLLVPVLHLTKTGIYLEIKTPTDLEFSIYGPTSATRDLFGGPFFRLAWKKLRLGLVGLKNFVFNFRNLPFHFFSAISFILGIYVGEVIALHGLDQAIFSLSYVPGQINPTILGDIPLSAGFDIFLHNWLVSLSTALSGMWLVAPSLVTLGFNGMILGVVYYLTPSFTMFAAAIFPHGVIEIPSFIIAGSAGMRLGVAFIKSLGKGADSSEALRFYGIARETIYVVIGLAVLFFIAGLIEGNLTPVIMRMYGWR
jgi:stage II sporulation protein M